MVNRDSGILWRRLFLASGSAALACILPGLSRAQTENPPAATPGLEEIVVTAQRRSENLQNVPISVQVVSGQTLTDQNLNSLEDVSATVPSVHIGENGRSSDLYIRGIGSGENQAFDQSVGTFVDDIYHGRSRMTAATFLDLDRVEVLKGPQSTFFGNNAIAGAFNITTNKPTNEFDASARVLYGEYGQYAAEAAVSGPLADTLAVRLAGIALGTNGWLDEINLGEHVPRERNAAGRLTTLFHPTDNLDATLKVEVSRNRNTGALGIQIGACPPPPPYVASGFCSAALAQHVPTGIDNTNDIAQSPGQAISLDSDEYVLTVNYRNWNQTFTSVTGYYSYRYNLNLDGDDTPATLLNIQAPEHYNQYSQELRVQSSTDGPVQYLAGAYVQNDQLRFNQDFGYFFLTPTVESLPPFAPLVPYLPLAQNTNYVQPEDTYSLFGSVSWSVTDKLTLSEGLRGSHVRKTYDWDLYYGTATQAFGGISPLPSSVAPLAPLLGLGAPGTLSGSRTDHAWMPSSKIQYKFDPSMMGYFSYAKGFKAGGFNGADNTGIASNLPYGPEHVNAYELGIKSTWLDNRVLLNFDLFRSDYTDLQVSTNLASTTGTFVSLVKNAASSRSQGAELEAQWVATREFRLSAELTYLDAYYVSYPNVSPTQLQQFEGLATQDLSGKPTEFAPKWSGSVTGTYAVALPGNYAFITELTDLISSSYFLSGTDDPTVEQSSYERLDARLSLENSEGHWAFDVIGKNLTDRTILTFAAPYTLSPGSLYGIKQSTRSVAAQVRWKWR
jgi:iron complex outermembrane receptor protein